MSIILLDKSGMLKSVAHALMDVQILRRVKFENDEKFDVISTIHAKCPFEGMIPFDSLRLQYMESCRVNIQSIRHHSFSRNATPDLSNKTDPVNGP